MRVHAVLRLIGIGVGMGMAVLASLGMGADGPAAGTTAGMSVEAPRHWRAPLTRPSAPTVEVIEQAQGLAYWIRIQTGEDVIYLKGERPCSTCDPEEEGRFFRPPQLIVDGQRFWIRLDEPGWRLNLRPAPGGDYELFLSTEPPKTEITEADLQAVRSALTPFGVLPARLELTPYVPPEKPEPPEGVRLDSLLYGLTLAPDWTDYALAHGLELSGLRAVVVVELTSPEARPPEGLDLVVESRSERLLRAQVLIHRLAELASDPAVSFVRPPAQPQPAAR